MESFTLAMRKSFRYAFYCLALVMILLALLPEYKVLWQSLLLGIGAGMVNTVVLLGKVWRVGMMAEDPTVRPRGTGFLQRILVAGIAGYLTVLFPHLFALPGVLIGLFLVQGLGFILVYRSIK